MMKLTEKIFWDKTWKHTDLSDKAQDIPFHDLFLKLLPIDRSYLEIGCTPGDAMVYFNRTFNYHVSGIDYSHLDLTEERLKSQGVKEFKLYNMDFTTKCPDEIFGVVASFGFIEHFEDVEFILTRHVNMLEDSGYLIVCVPNLRWIQYFLHSIFDRKVFKGHNMKIMKPRVLKEIAIKLGTSEILYCDYYKTFDFWIDSPENSLSKKIACKCSSMVKKSLQVFSIDSIPNRFFSPFIVLVARF